ncbi:ABC transporter substrate-binding protein [Paenibacillus sp. UNC451MF]|uniref:ABC transporter substrate-binding protein n=1 Tax=Paenibacillus sp. UNC451MF TaxID=1449063 RepID=UPI00048B81E2|nr:extracellular solute-binding protein [Paenibacillus sp. UNC451MF]
MIRLLENKQRALPVLLLLTLIAAGCQSGNSLEQKEEMEKKDPVTLKFYTGDKADEEQFKLNIADKFKAKFPHISIEFQTADFAALVASGKAPDIYYQGAAALESVLTSMNMQYDLSELIKKNQFDLSRIDPIYLEGIKNISASYGGTYFGLPGTVYTPVLMYNKDIFDKFGIAYPKDGMTWEEAYALAKQLTLYHEGIQYRGFAGAFRYLFDNNQLGAAYFHPSQDKAGVNTDAWRSIISTYAQFYQIPMNQSLTSLGNAQERDVFAKDNTAAMFAGVTSLIESFPKEFTNWDMVSMPTMKDAPDTNLQLNPRYYYIMSTSKYKEEAFKLIEFVLSNEVQMQQSRMGRVTVLKDQEVRNAFGADSPQLKGKHNGALYYLNQVKLPPPRDSKLVKVPIDPTKVFNDFALGRKDVNTALRDWEEEINRAIQSEKAK